MRDSSIHQYTSFDGASPPAFVREDLEGYVRCGVGVNRTGGRIDKSGYNVAMPGGPAKKPFFFVTVGGSALGILYASVLFSLGRRNEYLFPVWGVWIALGLGVAGGLTYRLVRRRDGHEVTCVVSALNLYSAVFSLGGYSYLGWAAVPVFAGIAAVPYFLFRRRERWWRIALGVNLALLAGTVMLEMYRSHAMTNADAKCRAEEETLPSFAHPIHGPRHPYDFGGRQDERYLGVAFGQTDQFYLLDADELQLKRAAHVPKGVQRVTSHPRLPLFALPPWSKMGKNERIEFIDRNTGALVGQTPVAGCRNLFTIAFLDDRMYALCEVSHTLHEFGADPPFPQLRSLTLPGMDAYDLAIDPTRRRAFVSDYISPWLTEVDLEAMKIVRRKWVGPFSFHIAFAPDGRLYLAQMLLRRVLALDPQTLEVVREIPAGYGPRDFDFDQGRGLLLIGNYYDGTVDVVGLADGRRRQRFFVGGLLRGLWFDDTRDRLYLAAGCGVRWVAGGALAVDSLP